MTTPSGYNRLQIILHWSIAVLIFAAFFTHEEMHEVFDDRLASGATPGPSDGTLHTMLGGVAFLLIIIRVIVRRRHGAPGAPEGTSATLAKASHLGHIAIYVLMIGVPIGGMVAWFGGVEVVGNIHGLVGKLLILLALGHAGMALYHQFLIKDGTLTRMLKSSS